MSGQDPTKLIEAAYQEQLRLQALIDAKKVDLAAIKVNVTVNKIQQLATLLNLAVPSTSSNVTGLGQLLFDPARAKISISLLDVEVADVAAATGVSTDQVLAYVEDVKKRPVLPSTVLKFVQGLPVTPTDLINEIRARQTLAGSSVAGHPKDLGPPPPPPPPPPGGTTYFVKGLPDVTTILAGPFPDVTSATSWLRDHLAVLASRGWELVDSNGTQLSNQPPPPPPPSGPKTYQVTGTQPNGQPFAGSIPVTPPDTVEATKARLEGLGYKNLVFTPV
jgi:hypothetical protein